MGKIEKLILGIVIIAIAIVGIALVKDDRRNQVIVEEFEEPTWELAAVAGAPDVDDPALRYGQLQIGKDFAVGLCMDPQVVDGQAKLYFASMEDNAVWTRIQLLDESGAILGESGILKPGEYVESIGLGKVPKKSGLVIAKILSYEADTYYSQGTATAQVMLHVE